MFFFCLYRFGGYGAVATVVSNIASRFTTESQEAKLKAFNVKNKEAFGTSYSTLEKAETTVAENLLWSKNKLGTFKTYLEKRGNNGSATVSAYTALTLLMAALLAMIFH